MKLYYLRIGWQQDCYGLKEFPDITQREGRSDGIRGTLITGRALYVSIPPGDRYAIVEQEDLAEPVTIRGKNVE